MHTTADCGRACFDTCFARGAGNAPLVSAISTFRDSRVMWFSAACSCVVLMYCEASAVRPYRAHSVLCCPASPPHIQLIQQSAAPAPKAAEPQQHFIASPNGSAACFLGYTVSNPRRRGCSSPSAPLKACTTPCGGSATSLSRDPAAQCAASLNRRQPATQVRLGCS